MQSVRNCAETTRWGMMPPESRFTRFGILSWRTSQERAGRRRHAGEVAARTARGDATSAC
ncbi:MAG: hypothetical protein E5W31_00675 [Mesorhizobium sp.]|nr:MAG: hypothetical protein E5W31_00675 [Mesorhizobium sp.]